MYINIPERWWIWISVMCSMVAIIVLGIGVYFLMIRPEPEEQALSVTLTPTQVANTFPPPRIVVIAPPLRTKLNVPVVYRIQVLDDFAGLQKVTIYVNDFPAWDPTIIADQQALITTFPWIPDIVGTNQIRIEVQTVDGRTASQEFPVVTEDNAQGETGNEVNLFTLTIQALDDPFEIASGFGVCPGELIDVNPTLSSIQPGDEFFIPQLTALQTTGRSCEAPPNNFFLHPQIGRRILRFAKVFPIDPGYGTSRGFGCAVFFTGISAENSPIDCPSNMPNFHSGLDVGAPAGTPITAIVNGTVIFAGVDNFSNANCASMQGSLAPHNGYGRVVVLESKVDNYVFIYAHLSDITVREEQEVRANQVLGMVGSTGCSTAPHLHFEAREYTRGTFGSSGYFFRDPIPYFESVVVGS